MTSIRWLAVAVLLAAGCSGGGPEASMSCEPLALQCDGARLMGCDVLGRGWEVAEDCSLREGSLCTTEPVDCGGAAGCCSRSLVR